MNQDPYYNLREVSNSDLGWLQNLLYPRDMPDPTKAYRFGNLLDAMITEQERVNYFKRTCDEDVFTKEEFSKAVKMKDSFYNNEFCQAMLVGAETQAKMNKVRVMNYNGFEFEMGVRCKWDLWKPSPNFGGDIKSTTATTQRQFEAAVKYFHYPRQRAWYMDIADSNQDFLIGISKVNYKIFKVAIHRGDEIYTEGYNEYINLAFKFYSIFGSWKS